MHDPSSDRTYGEEESALVMVPPPVHGRPIGPVGTVDAVGSHCEMNEEIRGSGREGLVAVGCGIKFCWVRFEWEGNAASCPFKERGRQLEADGGAKHSYARGSARLSHSRWPTSSGRVAGYCSPRGEGVKAQGN